MKLNPEFDDLNNPDTILNHIEDLKVKQNPFPVEVFPKPIQEIIMATNESLKFPIDFIGSSILYAACVSIGNTHKAEIMKGWQENAVLYLAIVGRAGTNKSHPISFALNPIEEIDQEEFRKFEKELIEYKKKKELTKKEREEQGIGKILKPVWEQIIVTDFTPEALADIHKHNVKGIGVYVDELASWFNNFNRYNKGSEEQFWLSVWSGKAIRINRKLSDPTLIQSPFIPVIGTIQPGVLNQLADNRTENGFLDRLLFVVPDNLKKEYWSEKELDQLIFENWKNIISNLLGLQIFEDLEENIKPEILRFTPEAKQLLFEFQRQLTDQSNLSENEVISGINAKIEMYAVRFALILEMLRFACSESNKKAIGVEAVQGALKLVEYFKKTAVKVNSMLSNANPLDKLPTDKQNLYAALPDTFTTSEGILIAESMGIAKRTFKRFLNQKEIFKWIKQGSYEKLY